MKRLLPLLGCCLLALCTAACGPLQTPMPPRLDDEGQKAIDESWDKALSPVDRFDHQGILDLLISTQAYQVGVDRLTFRSEKRFSAGTVIMEISFDRLAPEMDRFEITMLDLAGKPVRKETYDRKKVESTYRELFVDCEQLRKKKENGSATPEELRRLAGYEARRSTIEHIFPKPKGKDDQPAPVKAGN
jgi:hypothetical protein